MLLPIYLYGHPVLREEAEDIDKDYPELEKLIADMWETMYNAEGVGLAAPQIGRPIALIVLDGSVLAETFPECKDSKMVLLNPYLEVLEDVEPVTRDEGCLSLPGMYEPVKRHEHVRLTWQDENFVEHEKEFSGYLSRIMQHEFRFDELFAHRLHRPRLAAAQTVHQIETLKHSTWPCTLRLSRESRPQNIQKVTEHNG